MEVQRYSPANKRKSIAEALARGYCSPENSSKELDSTLINAMADEVLKLLGTKS